jgi:hypothetical protein
MGVREWNRDQLFRIGARQLGIATDTLAGLVEAHAIATLDIGDAGKRITATRLLAIGPLALAARKQTGHAYVTFAVDGRVIHQAEVPTGRDQTKTREWIAEFNRRAA